jgi:hypothetical protein
MLSIYSVCLILLTTLFSGPADHTVPDKWSQELNQTIELREEAVNRKDWSLFARTFMHQDKQYVKEQKRWFEDAIRYVDPNSYHLRIERIEPKSQKSAQVWIKQSYRHANQLLSNRFPLLFCRTANGWRDQDFLFHQMKRDQIRIFYTDPSLSEKAHVALDIAQRAQVVLADRFQWHPERITVKLYHQPEWFRQSVKLSLPKWAGGWNEAAQSIKLVVDHQNVRSFASSLVHELVHQMVSDRSHDNAAYWFQEGAAMYYEAHLLPGLHEEVPEQVSLKPYTLHELEKTNLEKLNDRDAFRYYYSCYQLFHFLVETYGEEKIDSLLTALSKYPIVDHDSEQKIGLLNKRTEETLQKTFGISVSVLDKQWAQFRKQKKREQEIELPTFSSDEKLIAS